jgi:thymidylate synthase (FAD)
MSNKINVLDHGFVRLVDHMGSCLSVVRAARNSYDAAWRAGDNEKSDEKLINYLWSHRHTTPFETVTFTFEVKAPIFVFRQWHRHRTWSYNEVSARYTELPEEFYVPSIDVIGKQSKDNKQARDISELSYAEKKNNDILRDGMFIQNTSAFNTYKTLLEEGVPRELARSVLPVATYSKMFGTVNLLNLLKFIELRDHSHAQYEIQVYARAMLELIEPIVPVCVAAFKKGLAK